MTFDDLRLKREQHGAIVGQTGTGKSVLGTRLIPGDGRVIIIDPKASVRFESFPVFTSASKLISSRPEYAIYRPGLSELGNLKEYDKVYTWILERGNTFCYTDDVVGIMSRTRSPDAFRGCYMLGRERGVRMLSSFQRPVNVPPFMLTDGYEKPPDQHTFYHYSVYDDKSGEFMKLNLGASI